jgi:2-keto-4-pentenoate hydratase/2-oxohepta-3-ene-1,7-dioic acid hydratase in catechol pathway
VKIASYSVGGRESFGIVHPDDGITDLGKRFGGSLRTFLDEHSTDELKPVESSSADWSLDQVTLQSVVPDARKIIGVGINYHAHALEGTRPIGENPILFLRTGQSVVGHGSAIVRPRVSEQLDYEGELAVVIGKGGRHIAPLDVMQHIAGYCCFNDGSVRDYQAQSVSVGKSFEKSGACGPWMVTCADAGADPFSLITRVNGEERQRVTTDKMIFSIAEIVAFASSFTTLLPGDIVATGTPAGVGFRRTPPSWLKAGDEVEVEISRIGILRNKVIEE